MLDPELAARREERKKYNSLLRKLYKIRRQLQSSINNIELYEKRASSSICINNGVNISNLEDLKEKLYDRVSYIQNTIIPDVEQRIESL